MLEAQGRWEDAIEDYRTVLRAVPEDPSAWNNLGNASAGLGRCSSSFVGMLAVTCRVWDPKCTVQIAHLIQGQVGASHASLSS